MCPHAAVQKDFADCPCNVSLCGLHWEEGIEESVPWPISEGRAGGKDVEREAVAGILGEWPVTLGC